MQKVDRPALDAQLSRGAIALGISLTERQKLRLLDYLALLVKWNGVYNLTAIREPEQMISHHLLDSLAAVPAFAEAHHVLDVGAGGGLPGIVLAIWAADAQPDMRIVLVDTVHKKTAFLTQVKAELGLTNVTVYTARVEQLQISEKFDVITSRAFAELKDFITWSGYLLEDGGCFIAMKGVMPQDEIARLPEGWIVDKAQPLAVPGLDAQRHLLFIKRET